MPFFSYSLILSFLITFSFPKLVRDLKARADLFPFQTCSATLHAIPIPSSQDGQQEIPFHPHFIFIFFKETKIIRFNFFVKVEFIEILFVCIFRRLPPFGGYCQSKNCFDHFDE